MGAADKGVGWRGSGLIYLGNDLCCGCIGSCTVWVGDVGDFTMNWEDLGRIPPQGFLQTDGTATRRGIDGRWVYH